MVSAWQPWAGRVSSGCLVVSASKPQRADLSWGRLTSSRPTRVGRGELFPLVIHWPLIPHGCLWKPASLGGWANGGGRHWPGGSVHLPQLPGAQVTAWSRPKTPVWLWPTAPLHLPTVKPAPSPVLPAREPGTAVATTEGFSWLSACALAPCQSMLSPHALTPRAARYETAAPGQGEPGGARAGRVSRCRLPQIPVCSRVTVRVSPAAGGSAAPLARCVLMERPRSWGGKGDSPGMVILLQGGRGRFTHLGGQRTQVAWDVGAWFASEKLDSLLPPSNPGCRAPAR